MNGDHHQEHYKVGVCVVLYVLTWGSVTHTHTPFSHPRWGCSLKCYMFLSLVHPPLLSRDPSPSFPVCSSNTFLASSVFSLPTIPLSTLQSTPLTLSSLILPLPHFVLPVALLSLLLSLSSLSSPFSSNVLTVLFSIGLTLALISSLDAATSVSYSHIFCLICSFFSPPLQSLLPSSIPAFLSPLSVPLSSSLSCSVYPPSCYIHLILFLWSTPSWFHPLSLLKLICLLTRVISTTFVLTLKGRFGIFKRASTLIRDQDSLKSTSNFFCASMTGFWHISSESPVSIH